MIATRSAPNHAGSWLDELPLLLTVAELQNVLRVSAPQAYATAHSIGVVRIGRALRVPRAALAAWLVNQA